MPRHPPIRRASGAAVACGRLESVPDTCPHVFHPATGRAERERGQETKEEEENKIEKKKEGEEGASVGIRMGWGRARVTKRTGQPGRATVGLSCTPPLMCMPSIIHCSISRIQLAVRENTSVRWLFKRKVKRKKTLKYPCEHTPQEETKKKKAHQDWPPQG